jgi:hypothetical protein
LEDCFEQLAASGSPPLSGLLSPAFLLMFGSLPLADQGARCLFPPEVYQLPLALARGEGMCSVLRKGRAIVHLVKGRSGPAGSLWIFPRRRSLR